MSAMDYPFTLTRRIRPIDDVSITSLDLNPTTRLQALGRAPMPMATIALPYNGQCQVTLTVDESAALQSVLDQVLKRAVREMATHLADLTE